MKRKKDLTPDIQIGVLVQKCVCRKNPCVCGSHGPKFINQEAHQRFVDNLFEAIKAD